ncbi:hypothetical protein AB0395_44780 [Streptosporangium sp. NPDC051023]|uniref:hypothetical protein n=1 Tax=Streptosporangium sp. NPDC051023 TaxID=3155410 RepID=UPI00344E6A75
MATKTTQPPRADWSLLPRGTVSATGQGALVLAALGAGGNALELGPWWAAAGATVGVIATALAGGQLHPRTLGYRVGCWLGAGGWLTWAWLDTPWNLNVLAALSVGALGAGLLAPWAHPPQPAPSTASTGSTGAMVVRRYAGLAEEWADRVKRVAKIGVQIEDVREWPSKCGHDLLVLQPLGASSTSTLKGAVGGLAEDARLPNGCGVEWLPGPFRGAMWMGVSRVDRLVETIDHPGITLGGSINDPGVVTVGEFRDGNPVTVALRESTMLVVGQKRSGKTGVLHSLTAALGALRDVVVDHMDLNGGGVSRAWLAPWLQGLTTRPAIDWAAPCPQEALLMAHAHVVTARDRKSAHAELKMQQDVQLLPVSEKVPAIFLMLDEGKEVLGTQVADPIVRKIRAHLETLVDIGGNEACNAVLSVLRSTATALSSDIKTQCTTRMQIRPSVQAEIDYLFDYHTGVSPQDVPHQGSGFLRRPDDLGPRAWKNYFMLPARDIHPAAIAIANHRPDRDLDAVRAAAHAYATRLERMRWLYSTAEERTRLTPPEPIELPGVTDERGKPIIWDPAVTHPAADGAPSREVGTRPPDAPVSSTPQRPASHLSLLQGGVTAGWGDPEAIAARARGQQPSARGPVREHPYPAGARPRLHAEQIHHLDAAEVPLPELVVQALALPWDTGRLHSEVLAKALGMTEHELAALLNPLGVRPLPNAFWRGGERGRGYERQHLVDVADAIRRGELDVPPEVADWPAA